MNISVDGRQVINAYLEVFTWNERGKGVELLLGILSIVTLSCKHPKPQFSNCRPSLQSLSNPCIHVLDRRILNLLGTSLTPFCQMAAFSLASILTSDVPMVFRANSWTALTAFGARYNRANSIPPSAHVPSSGNELLDLRGSAWTYVLESDGVDPLVEVDGVFPGDDLRQDGLGLAFLLGRCHRDRFSFVRSWEVRVTWRRGV